MENENLRWAKAAYPTLSTGLSTGVDNAFVRLFTPRAAARGGSSPPAGRGGPAGTDEARAELRSEAPGRASRCGPPRAPAQESTSLTRFGGDRRDGVAGGSSGVRPRVSGGFRGARAPLGDPGEGGSGWVRAAPAPPGGASRAAGGGLGAPRSRSPPDEKPLPRPHEGARPCGRRRRAGSRVRSGGYPQAAAWCRGGGTQAEEVRLRRARLGPAAGGCGEPCSGGLASAPSGRLRSRAILLRGGGS